MVREDGRIFLEHVCPSQFLRKKEFKCGRIKGWLKPPKNHNSFGEPIEIRTSVETAIEIEWLA